MSSHINIMRFGEGALDCLPIVRLDAEGKWYVAGEPTWDAIMILSAIWGGRVTMRA